MVQIFQIFYQELINYNHWSYLTIVNVSKINPKYIIYNNVQLLPGSLDQGNDWYSDHKEKHPSFVLKMFACLVLSTI